MFISRKINAALIDMMNYELLPWQWMFSVLEGWLREAGGFLHTKALTWTFLDTKCTVGVLGSGVVLQLKRRGVVHKRLRALGHARPTVIEIGARLRKKHTTPGQLWTASRSPDARGGVVFWQHPRESLILVAFWKAQLSLSSLDTELERNWTTDPAPRCKRSNILL